MKGEKTHRAESRVESAGMDNRSVEINDIFCL